MSTNPRQSLYSSAEFMAEVWGNRAVAKLKHSHVHDLSLSKLNPWSRYARAYSYFPFQVV